MTDFPRLRPPQLPRRERQFRARSACSPAARRTGKVDPLLPFPIWPGTRGERQKPAVGATGRMRKKRTSLKQTANASVRSIAHSLAGRAADFCKRSRRKQRALDDAPDDRDRQQRSGGQEAQEAGSRSGEHELDERRRPARARMASDTPTRIGGWMFSWMIRSLS